MVPNSAQVVVADGLTLDGIVKEIDTEGLTLEGSDGKAIANGGSGISQGKCNEEEAIETISDDITVPYLHSNSKPVLQVPRNADITL